MSSKKLIRKAFKIQKYVEDFISTGKVLHLDDVLLAQRALAETAEMLDDYPYTNGKKQQSERPEEMAEIERCLGEALKSSVGVSDGEESIAETELQEDNPRRVERMIRKLARKHSLIARCKTISDWKGKDRRWWFANENNHLQSPENGIIDEEALEFLNS